MSKPVYRIALPAASLALAMASQAPAKAFPCPKGQILRVHLSQCVDINSALAWAYVRPAQPRRPEPAAPPLPPAPVERPIALPGLTPPDGIPAFVLPSVAWPQ
jgi:hypothetical protein